MNERLLKIMEYFNYSPSIFADEIGVIRSSISHIISGRNNPGLELLQKVLIRFPQVSSDWLLLGRGEMMLNDDEMDKKRMTIVNQPKKIGQLNLDDFTNPSSNQAPPSRPVQKPAEPVISQNTIPAPEKSQPAVPVKEATVTQQVQQERPEPVKAAEITRSGGKVKRVTIFFDDNSFQDFVENK
jgi:transcriptional regulator with XRE-family HTH domain